MHVASLHIYPVKSLGGIELSQSEYSNRGLQHDRRWMIVDDAGNFLTQRRFASMALIKVSMHKEGFVLSKDGYTMVLPFSLDEGPIIKTSIWSFSGKSMVAPALVNEWLSEMLHANCRAVYMPDTTVRKPHFYYAKSKQDRISYVDGYPILMISQASLTDLNSRLETTVTMDRFRPSIVIDDTQAYEEDSCKEFTINGQTFYGVKPCGRCIVVCTNQHTAMVSKEPLKTLASYRTKRNKVLFGMNVIPAGEGFIKVGDEVIKL